MPHCRRRAAGCLRTLLCVAVAILQPQSNAQSVIEAPRQQANQAQQARAQQKAHNEPQPNPERQAQHAPAEAACKHCTANPPTAAWEHSCIQKCTAGQTNGAGAKAGSAPANQNGGEACAAEEPRSACELVKSRCGHKKEGHLVRRMCPRACGLCKAGSVAPERETLRTCAGASSVCDHDVVYSNAQIVHETTAFANVMTVYAQASTLGHGGISQCGKCSAGSVDVHAVDGADPRRGNNTTAGTAGVLPHYMCVQYRCINKGCAETVIARATSRDPWVPFVKVVPAHGWQASVVDGPHSGPPQLCDARNARHNAFFVLQPPPFVCKNHFHAVDWLSDVYSIVRFLRSNVTRRDLPIKAVMIGEGGCLNSAQTHLGAWFTGMLRILNVALLRVAKGAVAGCFAHVVVQPKGDLAKFFITGRQEWIWGYRDALFEVITGEADGYSPAKCGHEHVGQTINIIIETREGSKRRFANMTNMVQQLSMLNRVRFENLKARATAVAMGNLTMAEQVKLLRSTHILVQPHGAGLTNTLFLCPGSASVQLLGKGIAAAPPLATPDRATRQHEQPTCDGLRWSVGFYSWLPTATGTFTSVHSVGARTPTRRAPLQSRWLEALKGACGADAATVNKAVDAIFSNKDAECVSYLLQNAGGTNNTRAGCVGVVHGAMFALDWQDLPLSDLASVVFANIEKWRQVHKHVASGFWTVPKCAGLPLHAVARGKLGVCADIAVHRQSTFLFPPQGALLTPILIVSQTRQRVVDRLLSEAKTVVELSIATAERKTWCAEPRDVENGVWAPRGPASTENVTHYRAGFADGPLSRGYSVSSAQCVATSPSARSSKLAAEWAWQPAKCSLRPFSSAHFCDLLGNGLLVVGDSISEQLAIVIASLMSDTRLPAARTGASTYAAKNRAAEPELGDCHRLKPWWPQNNSIHYRFKRFCMSWEVCGKRSRVTFLFTNFLAPVKQTTSDASHNGDFAWSNDPAFLRSFGVILLNTGAHSPGWNISGRVTSAMDALLSSGTNATIFYRDTPRGHSDCEHHVHAAPMQSVAEGEAYQQQHPGNPKHKWAQIPDDNRIARSVISHYPGVTWLPVAAMTLPRWDAHRGSVRGPKGGAADCLHFCQPGPLEEWARLLMHFLWVQGTRSTS